jgi:hypothetical protein
MIRTISFGHPQIAARKENRRARDVLALLLCKFGVWMDRLEVEVWCSSKAVSVVGKKGNFQAPFWLVSAIPFLREDEDLAIGWERGADAWHNIEMIRTAFNSLQHVMGKTGKMVLPLEYVDKFEVYRGLREKGLLAKTWTCEKSTKNGRACGRCPPCVVRRNTLKCM